LARMQGKSWERPIIVPESLWDSPPVVMKRGIQILDSILKEREKETKKSGFDDLDDFAKGGPYVGPRGGKWADAKHTIPWKDEGSKTGKKDGSDPSGRLKELSIAHQSALRSQVKAGLLAEQIEKQTQKTITSSKVADSAYERAWDMREGANRKLAVAERAVREIESQMEKLPGGEDLADLNFKRRSNDIGKSMHAEQGSELAKSFYESKDVLDWANRFWDGKSVQIEALALAKELLELRQKFGGGDSPIAATKNIDTEYEKKRKTEEAIIKKMHALEIKHLDTERKRVEARAKIDKSESQRFEALTPARQRDMTAHEQAGQVSRLRKGEDVYVATIGLAPPPQPSAPLEKGRTGHQGVVAYSEGSDMEVSRLFKSGDDFYTGGSPSVIPFSRPIGVGKVCPACGTAMSKSLTACPACGAGTVTHRVLPRGEAPGDEGDGSASIRKSRSGLLKPHIVKDVKFDR